MRFVEVQFVYILVLCLLPKLRIKVECAFGMPVCRWGVLRRALLASMGLCKTTALVMALCRLHNFCADIRVCAGMFSPNQPENDVPDSLATDALEIAGNGGVPLVSNENNRTSPEQLLDAGHHHKDTTPAFRRQFSRRGLGLRSLPRETLRDVTFGGGFRRPTPILWHQK